MYKHLTGTGGTDIKTSRPILKTEKRLSAKFFVFRSENRVPTCLGTTQCAFLGQNRKKSMKNGLQVV
jgi:hypothetical protein